MGRVPDLAQPQDKAHQDDSPLRIRIEHVGSDDIGQATTIPDALSWLETRMRRLFPGASRQRPPSQEP